MERESQPDTGKGLFALWARRAGRLLFDIVAAPAAVSGPPSAVQRYFELRAELGKMRVEGEAALEAGWHPVPAGPAEVGLSAADELTVTAFRHQLVHLAPEHFGTPNSTEN